MKKILFSLLILSTLLLFGAEKPPFAVPENFEKVVSESKFNWFEKRVNLTLYKAVSDRKVVLEKLSDYIFLQAVPSFAYADEKGEDRLGEDLMGLLGTIASAQDTVILPLEWNQLKNLGLPFKKSLMESMLFGKDTDSHFELTFFIEMNKLTGRVRETLNRQPGLALRYNSQSRFYRVGKKGVKAFVMIHLPNIAYEVIFTGNTPENVVKEKADEVKFILDSVETYEKRILADKKLTYDGRYIRGKGIMVDLWFLYGETKGNKKMAKMIFEKVIKGKPVKVTGSEKSK